MSHFQNQYDANPVRQPVQVDEYGNPIAQTGTYGTTGGTYETTGHHKHKEQGGLGGMLHRSGSSSSSSSEDDGYGGRRKKGVKEKIKEKLPGGHREDQSYATSTTTPGGYGYGSAAQGQHPEKKGMMDKIKEKLPGGHHN